MKLKDLHQAIRDQIGAEGPQLPAEEYEERISDTLSRMTVAEFLVMLEYMEIE